MSAYLSFEGVRKLYGTVTALDRVTLNVERGAAVAVLGPNGSGKSTLFGCLLGLVSPGEGCVRVEGRSPSAPQRLAWGYLPERVTLYADGSVHDNLFFFARLKGATAENATRQLARLELEQHAERAVRALSKGLLQRLGLAIALLNEPALLVLDEPFNGLDPVLLDRVLELVREEHQRGATLLVSTHAIGVLEPLVTHAAILLNGTLCAYDSVERLREVHGSAAEPAPSLEDIYRRIARERHRGQPEADRACAGIEPMGVTAK